MLLLVLVLVLVLFVLGVSFSLKVFVLGGGGVLLSNLLCCVCSSFVPTLLLFLSLSLSAAPFSIMVPLNVRVKPLTEERHHHHQTKLPLLPSS